MRKFLWLMILCSGFLLCGCQSSSQEDTLPEYPSVAEMNAAAESLAENGNYAEALQKYAEAMKTDPLDITAILGAAKCQTALKNYSTAATDLDAALQIDPKDPRIYELYTDLSRQSEDMSYVETAISLAKNNQAESFLNRIPDPPKMSAPEGAYDSPFSITMSAQENAEIFVNEKTDFDQSSYSYAEPISIRRGTTTLEVYCIKDGIPSDTEIYTYTCEYPPKAVQFADPVIELIVRESLGNSNGTITDADCEKVTKINAYDYQQSAGLNWDDYSKLRVRSFDDLKLFPNLQEFNLDQILVEDVSDYSPLITCKKSLNELSFSDMQLNDISFLSDFSNLQFVNFRDCSIHDLTPLRNSPNLDSLYLQGNPIDDLSAVKEFDQLHSLGFSISKPEDLSVLPELKDLQDVTLYNCGSNDLRVLKELKNLQYLYLYDLDNYDAVEIIKTLKNLNTLVMYARYYDVFMPGDMYAELQASLPNCQIYTFL